MLSKINYPQLRKSHQIACTDYDLFNTFGNVFIINIRETLRTYLIIGIGLLALSSASIFIRLADDIPSIVIAVYRLTIAGVFLAGATLKKGESLYSFDASRENRLILLAGVALALHFVFWIESLKLTTIASSVALVYTLPIWTALFSRIFLKETLSQKQLIGVLSAVSGAAIIGFYGLNSGESSFIGNLLAVAGGFMMAVNLTIGRVLRRSKSTIAYSGSVYLVAAFVVFILTLVFSKPLTGYSNQMYILLIMIGIIPQLIGHTSFNWALKQRSATSVSVFMLGEPIGATLLGIFILSEIPVRGEIIGGLILLTGLYLTSSNSGDQND